jgi:hypothetical protein
VGHPLRPYFPSCGGKAADCGGLVGEVMAQAPRKFWQNLAARHRRPYAPARARLWMSPAMLFFQRRSLPYYLVGFDAGAGLDLVADLAEPAKGFDSLWVAARIGLDAKPLSSSDDDRRWLSACLATEDAAGLQALSRALATLRASLAKDPAFLQLRPCASSQPWDFVMRHIPPDRDVGLLTLRLLPGGLTLDEGARQALEPWDDRGLAVDLIAAKPEPFCSSFRLRAQEGFRVPRVGRDRSRV